MYVACSKLRAYEGMFTSRNIYVHCYGHLLILALQDTMTAIETLRNALGTIQSLYNFLHASRLRRSSGKETNESFFCLIIDNVPEAQGYLFDSTDV